MLKHLCLLLSGSIISFLIVNTLSISTLPLISLIALSILPVILVLFGTSAFSTMNRIYTINTRGAFSKKIGILYDMGKLNTGNCSWTDIDPEDWKREIENISKSKNIQTKIEFINVDYKFEKYLAIINPYGGVYPETDVNENETLRKIFDYVKDGGLFVNVADIPGYWVYNKKINRTMDATPAIYFYDKNENNEPVIKPYRFFEKTPFMEKLGLQVLNTEGDSESPVEFERDYKQFTPSIENIFIGRAVKTQIKNVESVLKYQDITPLFFVLFGNGKFLISLIFYDKNYQNNYKIKFLLCKLIVESILEDNT